MISVSEAKKLINAYSHALPAKELALQQAAGLTLAQDIYAPNNFPPFRQSAMDGYAFCFDEWNNQPLQVQGVVQAGTTQENAIQKSHAVRIFTGAPLPGEMDTVVMQEKVNVVNGMLHILDNGIQKGVNVRQPGSEIERNTLGISSGTFLSAAATGFIAGLGIKQVIVIPRPVVSILVTGKELQQPGEPLQYGQVYESNSYALTAALAQLGIVDVTTKTVDDDLELLTEEIRSALLIADLLLLSGGVSVGDYDFVAKALEACGVETVFHKIKQKPGKPLLFAKKEHKLIFGLPGNPSSVLTCYYEYVQLAIQQMMGLQNQLLRTIQLPLGTAYKKAAGLTHFLKAKVENGGVIPLNAQESYRMRSFAVADCLIVLEEEKDDFQKGDLVEVHLMKQMEIVKL